MKNILLIVCDGLSDRPIKELGGKTPLEAAHKPNFTALLARGMCGIMHTVDVGVRPGSDVAHLSLLGYDPNVYYTGRGPFEAAGYGIDMHAGDVALRGNFATLNEKGHIIDRRAGRIDETEELIKAVQGIIIDGVEVLVKKGVGHRVAVVLRGAGLDGNISDNDPHHEGVAVADAVPKKHTKEAVKTARVVNIFTQKAYEILKNHSLNQTRKANGLPPANIILLRGAGLLPVLPPFVDKYALRAACIAGAGLYKGIAKILGMTILDVPGTTGKPDSNLQAKITAALAALETYDFVFVHIKAADSLAEDGNFEGKKSFIEKIDAALAPLVSLSETLIAITADHTTSSFLKKHTADPVPVLIAGSNIHTDHVKEFGERAVAQGKLGHIRGRHLMPLLLDFIGRAPLVGA